MKITRLIQETNFTTGEETTAVLVEIQGTEFGIPLSAQEAQVMHSVLGRAYAAQQPPPVVPVSQKPEWQPAQQQVVAPPPSWNTASQVSEQPPEDYSYEVEEDPQPPQPASPVNLPFGGKYSPPPAPVRPVRTEAGEGKLPTGF